MTVSAQLADGRTLKFPDGTDPAVVQNTVKQIVSGTHPSQAQDNNSMAPAAPQTPQPPTAAAGAAQPVQPSAAAPQQPIAGGGDGWLNTGEKMAENAADIGFAGQGEDIGAAMATLPTWALKNIMPKSMGGESVTLPQTWDAMQKIKGQKMSDLQAWNEQNPVKAFGSQMAGGMATMGPAAKLFAAAAPETANALSAFAKANPYTAASAGGAISGGLIGAGTAQPGNTAASGVAGAAGGAILGPLFKYAGDEILSPALDKVKSSGSALQDFLHASEPAEESSAPKTSPTLGFSTITNQPMDAQPESGPITGKIPLTPGVAAKDPNLLRVEENARQGLLGPESQTTINNADAATVQAARDVGQNLKGDTNAPSHELFENSIQQFQDAGDKSHTEATAKYTALNQAAANTVLDKSKVGPSLGGKLNDVVNDPDNISAFKSKAGQPAAQLYQDFKDIIKGTKGKELPFNDLQAWRQDVAAVAGKMQKGPDTVAAGRLGQAYDEWMANDFSQKHVISGDANVAQLAKDASASWKQYKTNFDEGASPFMSGQPKPFDLTPADYVNKVVGKTGMGTPSTAVQVRGMVQGLPTDEAKQQFKDNIFSGFISRAFEGVNGDTTALGKLRDNLQNFRNSQVYREQFLPTDPTDESSMAQKDKVLSNLIGDLNQYVQQKSRTDVKSPSGGAVLRGISAITGQINAGVGKFIPGITEGDALIKKVSDMSEYGADRATFNKAMKAAAKAAHSAARNGPVFDINSLKAGLAGGLAAGNVVQQNNGGTK